MKAKLVPLYLKSSPDEKFYQQTSNLKTLFKEEIDLLNPIPLGEKLPEAEDVYKRQLVRTWKPSD